MEQSEPSESIESPLSQWLRHPDRRILLVDETRATLAGEHREFIVFTGVLVDARSLVALVNSVDELRSLLPEVSKDESFKGKNLLHIFSDEQFRPLVMLVAKALARPARIFVTATTIKNVQESPAEVSIRAGNETGRPANVRGLELKVALNFILRVGRETVGSAGQLDVVVDRSRALGLDPRARQLPTGAVEAFVGKLAEDGPEFFILSDSDSGPFRDALLLPDFAGYLLVHKAADRMARERAEVTSGRPFFFREVLPGELAQALVAYGRAVSGT